MYLTAIVLTHNSEKTLPDCLRSISFAEKIIVFDNNSTDNTRNIARRAGAVVFKEPHEGNFAKQRNAAMKEAKTEWILFIDSDEEVTSELRADIMHVVDSKRNEQQPEKAFYLKRRDFWRGKELKHGELAGAYNKGIIRLMRKGSGTWKGEVHETFEVRSGEVGRLNGFINHYPHPTISDFLKDINAYSTIRARELYKEKAEVTSFQIMAYPFGKFIYTYFLKLGILDGVGGFVYSFMMSFHSFLVRAKLYQYYLDSSKRAEN